MEGQEATPRVNKQSINSYVGRVVRVVGKVLNVSGNIATLESADHQQLIIHKPDHSLYESPFVEIVGRVNNDCSVQEFTSFNFGKDFDLDNYNEMLDVYSKHKELFV